MKDEHGQTVLAVNVIEDVTEVKIAEMRERFLAEATKLMASSLNAEATLDKVAWAAVPEIADWCAVELLDQRGELALVALAHTDAERRELAREFNRVYPAPSGRAVQGGPGLHRPRLPRAGRGPAGRNLDPVLVGEQLIGPLYAHGAPARTSRSSRA